MKAQELLQIILYLACYKQSIKEQATLLETKNNVNQSTNIGKFDLEAKLKMPPDEQFEYMKLHWDEVEAKIKAMDERYADNKITLTEDEIGDMISKFRKENYDASLNP
ncbi:hypothetical protein [Parasediminibacterium sp. JCM 36343]|uniref:hypothetical protein n=1 Tax=Parasediminibacterium sp. JCM 36343 TaxID=3374279 RepID=UPI00397A7068